MVRSPDADTMYFSSKSTTFTAARWPTKTRRNVISFGDVMSQTAIDRSWKWNNNMFVKLKNTKKNNSRTWKSFKRFNDDQCWSVDILLPLSKWPSCRCWSVNAAQPRSDGSMCWPCHRLIHPRRERLNHSIHWWWLCHRTANKALNRCDRLTFWCTSNRCDPKFWLYYHVSRTRFYFHRIASSRHLLNFRSGNWSVWACVDRYANYFRCSRYRS